MNSEFDDCLRSKRIREFSRGKTLVESLLQAKRLREQADYYDEWSQAGAESLLNAAEKFLIIARQLTSKV